MKIRKLIKTAIENNRLISSWMLSCCLLVGCQSNLPPRGLTVQVQRVASGQTLEILSPENQQLLEKVRMIGIQAPDLRPLPWGEIAKNKLTQLLQDSNGKFSSVILEGEGQEKDRFGRRLAYVWYNGILVNEKLVAMGWVLADTELAPKYGQRLARAQEYARVMGYGIWQPENPMRSTPQEFREHNPF